MITHASFESDSDLVLSLEDLGFNPEDVYELIDGFAAPQPPAIPGVQIFRDGESLNLKLQDKTVVLSESDAPTTKWSLVVRHHVIR